MNDHRYCVTTLSFDLGDGVRVVYYYNPVLGDFVSESWTKNDVYHREDGPAIHVYGLCGWQHWYCNGKFHRIGGPAIIYEHGAVLGGNSNGRLNAYYINGKSAIKNEFYSND